MRNFFVNPVLEKEIKLRFRNKKTFISIGFYLFVIGFLMVGILYLSDYNHNSGFINPGEYINLFRILSYIQFFLVLFLIPAITAGAISSEREKQTLSMLLTTTQSSFGIIFSKLLSSVLFLLLLVVSSLPIYSFIFLFGGVSPGELLSVMGLLLFIIITFASIGVCISTFIRKTIVSIVLTYCVFIFLIGGTFFIQLLLQSNNANMTDWISIGLIGLNPVYAMMSVINPEITGINFFGTNLMDIPIWLLFIIIYTCVSAFLLKLCSSKLRPNMKKG